MVSIPFTLHFLDLPLALSQTVDLAGQQGSHHFGCSNSNNVLVFSDSFAMNFPSLAVKKWIPVTSPGVTRGAWS
ncbi:hypothetical protein M758_1G069600 [Ceratodon purpureus]|uniref:Secreted protein n=1 Tax=Ceratodon purpureus TaxID=3225 RepID=A0A8T0J2G2_CERPU|nr:hypothetical protein KC19_1G071000 [Ceratodon purpureus]KAG0629005.1 hypothetical protein M758_1G069600 [Ceratodon purpureus]